MPDDIIYKPGTTTPDIDAMMAREAAKREARDKQMAADLEASLQRNPYTRTNIPSGRDTMAELAPNAFQTVTTKPALVPLEPAASDIKVTAPDTYQDPLSVKTGIDTSTPKGEAAATATAFSASNTMSYTDTQSSSSALDYPEDWGTGTYALDYNSASSYPPEPGTEIDWQLEHERLVAEAANEKKRAAAEAEANKKSEYWKNMVKKGEQACQGGFPNCSLCSMLNFTMDFGLSDLMNKLNLEGLFNSDDLGILGKLLRCARAISKTNVEKLGQIFSKAAMSGNFDVMKDVTKVVSPKSLPAVNKLKAGMSAAEDTPENGNKFFEVANAMGIEPKSMFTQAAFGEENPNVIATDADSAASIFSGKKNTFSKKCTTGEGASMAWLVDRRYT